VPDDPNSGHVGGPVANVKIRLGEVQESHHTVGQVLSNAIGLKMSKPESILMFAYIVCSIQWIVTNALRILRPGNKLEYQEMNYMSSKDAWTSPENPNGLKYINNIIYSSFRYTDIFK
jgi:hypothetical protein